MPNEETIKQCTITLTRECNLRCRFCYAKSAGYMTDDRIDYDNLKKLVDFCSEAKVKYIVFTGGEPLLYPWIKDILRYIKEKKNPITVAIPTNGVLLEDLTLCESLIDSGVGYIDISMKGSDSREWYKMVGDDGFARQLQGIRNLAMLSVEFTCSMVVTPENVLTFCDAVQIAYDNGARQFSFTFIIDNEDAKEKDQAYLERYDPFALVELFFTQIDRLNAITKEWWIEYSFPICVYTEEQLFLLKGKLATPCQIHMKNAVTFNTKMELLPCDMYIDQKMGQFGIDFSSYQEFQELMENQNYRSVMQALQKLPSSECLSCRHMELCYGGCPVLWKNYSFEAFKNFKEDVLMAR